MITLALYCRLPGPIQGYSLLYLAYLPNKEELTDMAQRVILEGQFSSKEDRYMLVVSFSSKDKQTYYAGIITWEMNVIFRNYKKVFNKAYELAQKKVWPFAWRTGGEKYRINCALLQMNKAREMLTTKAWGG